MLPAPYDLRWTCTLIRRDLKGLAARCNNRIRSVLSNIPGVPDHTVRIETPACAPPQWNEVDTGPPIDIEPLCIMPPSSCRTASDSNSTLPTEVSQAMPERPATLYSLLGQKLKDLYASRERDLPHVERWTFRGAWLILHMATQYCASNPAHGILNPGCSDLNETALLFEILRYSTSNPVEPCTSRVSLMPSMPFAKSDVASRRHDSVLDTISMKRISNRTPALYWYIIFVGATDQTKTIQAAEYLLEHVWPEKDASAILEIVGNPAKVLSEDENNEFRMRLGPMLFPKYNALC